MIKDELIQIKISNKTLSYYLNIKESVIGLIKVGDYIEVSSILIQDGSGILITGICDFCGNEKLISKKKYNTQTKFSKLGFSCSKPCSLIKTKKTCLERYGVGNVFSSGVIKSKIKKKLIENYGVDNPSKSEILIKKRYNTCLERYGYTSASKSDVVKNKVIKTNIIKFGVSHPSKSKEIREKMEKTTFERWGVSNFSKTDIFSQRIRDIYFEKMFDRLRESGILIKSKNSKYLIECDNCGDEFEILYTLMYNRIKRGDNLCTNCNPKNTNNIRENEVFDLISENIKNVEQSNRIILNGQELDIYLPGLKLAFEFNGLYWHSELYKDRKYHINKTKKCEELGINLIHIWEDDWIYKQDIVKSIILNKIGKSKRIFARKCVIKEITDNKLIREFLDKNHIQGFVGSKVKVGLYYNDELVSLMTFGSLRKSLGYISKDGSYELLRFCNVLNTSVVGGASKLFKYFTESYKPNEVISYSDSSRGVGDLYKKLGFNLSHDSDPNYYWVIDGIRRHRFNFRKDKLVKEGYDKKQTEHSIMNERGYYRIFDCGSKKWIRKFKYL